MPINLWHPHHVMWMRYEVLISVSRCYPSARGRLPTRYSPVRRFPLTESTEASSVSFSLDLHVLSTPPAFVLSQDQTLVFNPLTLLLGFPRLPRFRSLSAPASSKTHFRINCRFFHSLCIVFKILAPLSRLSLKGRSLSARIYYHVPYPIVNTFFSFFFNFFILFHFPEHCFPQMRINERPIIRTLTQSPYENVRVLKEQLFSFSCFQRQKRSSAALAKDLFECFILLKFPFYV